MTDTACVAIFIAVLSFTGVIGGALISAWIQHRTARYSMEASERLVLVRMHEEEKVRVRESRFERIHGLLSELIVSSDPQSGTSVDYSKTTNLICQTQLLLNPLQPFERSLMSKMSALGLAAQEFVAMRSHPDGTTSVEWQHLLQAHAAVMDSARPVLSALQAPDDLSKAAQ